MIATTCKISSVLCMFKTPFHFYVFWIIQIHRLNDTMYIRINNIYIKKENIRILYILFLLCYFLSIVGIPPSNADPINDPIPKTIVAP